MTCSTTTSLYDNSKGKVTIKVRWCIPVFLTPGGVRPFGADNLTSTSRVDFDGTVRNVILEIDGFSSFNACKLTGPDGNEMDTEGFLRILEGYHSEGSSAANVPGSEMFRRCFP